MFNLMYLNINIYILSMTQEKNYGWVQPIKCRRKEEKQQQPFCENCTEKWELTAQ